ncbi:MAG: TOBE domain-containing protein, partial [Halothiobacillus sp.]
AEATTRIDSPLFTEEGPVSVLHGTLGTVDQDGLLPFTASTTPNSPPVFTFWLNRTEHHTAPAQNSQARLRILARDVALAREQVDGISMLNQIPATIQRIEVDAAANRQAVFLTLHDGQTLIAELSSRSVQALALKPEQAVFALVKTAALLDS